jgi:hypothetical protein
MSYKSINVLSSPKPIQKQQPQQQQQSLQTPAIRFPPSPGSFHSSPLATSASNHLNLKSPPANAKRNSLLVEEIKIPKLTVIKDPSLMPIPSTESRAIPSREFQFQAQAKIPPPPSNLNASSSSFTAGVKSLQQTSSAGQLRGPAIGSGGGLGSAGNVLVSSRKVNSKSEAKGVSAGPPIESFGTTFIECIDRTRAAKPTHTTLPKVNPVLDSNDFKHVNGFLLNRTASGKILGNAARHYISSSHVPYLPPEEPVGPNNPYQQLDDIWTKCWDNEAGAVYYYNNQTGEATWIAPDGSS